MYSADKSSIPREVIVSTRAVLLSSTKGVLLKRFNSDYMKLVGSIFPWRKNGFPSAVAMLQSMPDVVRFQYSEKDGDYRLFGIGSDDMFMPSWVVKAQGLGPSGNDLIGSEWKSSNDRKKILDRQRTWSGRKSENNVASIGEETNRLVYNQSGLVTTLFSLKTIPQDDMKMKLLEAINAVVPAVEVNFKQSRVYVRFSLIEEAARIIDQFNDVEFCGTKLSVVPAPEKMSMGTTKPHVKKKTSHRTLTGDEEIVDKCLEFSNRVMNGYLTRDIEREGRSHDQAGRLQDCGDESCDQTGRSCDSVRGDGHKKWNNSRFKMLERELGLDSDSFSDNDSSFEWDESLLDEPVQPLTNHSLSSQHETNYNTHELKLNSFSLCENSLSSCSECPETDSFTCSDAAVATTGEQVCQDYSSETMPPLQTISRLQSGPANTQTTRLTPFLRSVSQPPLCYSSITSLNSQASEIFPPLVDSMTPRSYNSLVQGLSQTNSVSATLSQSSSSSHHLCVDTTTPSHPNQSNSSLHHLCVNTTTPSPPNQSSSSSHHLCVNTTTPSPSNQSSSPSHHLCVSQMNSLRRFNGLKMEVFQEGVKPSGIRSDVGMRQSLSGVRSSELLEVCCESKAEKKQSLMSMVNSALTLIEK